MLNSEIFLLLLLKTIMIHYFIILAYFFFSDHNEKCQLFMELFIIVQQCPLLSPAAMQP